MRWLNGIIDLMAMSLSKLWEMVKDREAWSAVAHEVTESRTITYRMNKKNVHQRKIITFPQIGKNPRCLTKYTYQSEQPHMLF